MGGMQPQQIIRHINTVIGPLSRMSYIRALVGGIKNCVDGCCDAWQVVGKLCVLCEAKEACQSQVRDHVAGPVTVNAVITCQGPNDWQSGSSRIPLPIR